jgi:hypothetical protein
MRLGQATNPTRDSRPPECSWAEHLALDGELASCELTVLRYRLLHPAARLARA